MANYAFTTTAIQEAALTFKRGKVNTERATATPPLPPFDDNAAYVADYVGSTLMAPLFVEFVEARLQMVANAYRTATNAQRQAADTALGI
jgi:hypothetical protein